MTETEPEPSSPTDEPPSCELVDAAGALGAADCTWLRDRVSDAVRHTGARGEVRVRIVNDAEMSNAHERWGGVVGTTDVLTFDLADEPGLLDADILICADEARRQSETRGTGLRRELLLYAVHGVLHCLGHDDHDEHDAARMHAREDEILDAIGVGAVYAEGTR